MRRQIMSKIIYWVHASVDGFIDGPKGEFDWPVMGPELSAYSEGLDKDVDTLLFGRPVWQMMVGFWPNAEALSDDPHVAAFAPFWRATPKIVFSRTYPGDDWTSRVISANLAEEVAALKSRPGGGDLAPLTGLGAFAVAEAADRTVPRWATARRALRSPVRAWWWALDGVPWSAPPVGRRLPGELDLDDLLLLQRQQVV
jgi:dihydrofolate reductase